MTDARTDSRKVAVIGAGSVGGVFAAHLAAVHDVVACVRRPFDRYVIESPEFPVERPAVTATTPDELPWDGPADVVLVSVKAHQTAGAAEWFAPLCGPDTMVVSLQNGIEGVERLTPLAPVSAVVPSVVYGATELLVPGHILLRSPMRLIVPDDEIGRRVAEISTCPPLSIEPSDQHRREAWIKLGFNAAGNGLTALTGKPLGVFEDPGIAAIGRQLLTECWTIGQADGVELDLAFVDPTLTRLAGSVNGRPSMLQDRQAGRPTEYDAIYGAILRRSDVTGVLAPVTRIIHDLIAAGDPD